MSQLFHRKGTGDVLAWRNDGRWSKDRLPAWVTEGRRLGEYGGSAYVYARGGDLAVVCHPGQWLIKDEFGKIFVMSDKEFHERYEEG